MRTGPTSHRNAGNLGTSVTPAGTGQRAPAARSHQRAGRLGPAPWHPRSDTKAADVTGALKADPGSGRGPVTTPAKAAVERRAWREMGQVLSYFAYKCLCGSVRCYK